MVKNQRKQQEKQALEEQQRMDQEKEMMAVMQKREEERREEKRREEMAKQCFVGVKPKKETKANCGKQASEKTSKMATKKNLSQLY